jgi:hypothetical protein
MLKVPQRVFSFTDWARSRPRDPIPGDRLDIQFTELINAITATQRAIADVRSDDGKLRRGIITDDQLIPDLKARLNSDITGLLEPIRQAIRGSYTATIASEHQAELYAADAEAAARVAAQLTAGMDAIRSAARRDADYVSRASASVDADATDAENWGNYSQAQADASALSANLALQWAEYLAGPVVDVASAPAYISSSAFPHGLYYQPVEGGAAGLWSAKWWALYAQQLVGKGAFYYLGAWYSPPVPGGISPITGQRVPNPLSPGSLYYDLNTNTLYVWNGSSWAQQQLLTAAYTSEYIYIATAGQTKFSGPDSTGKTPVIGASPSRVHVSGLLLSPSQYTANTVDSSLTLGSAPGAGATVQWDLLAPPPVPGAVNAFKVVNLNPDGTRTAFPVQYIDPSSGHTADVIITSATQLIVCQDGVLQEPGGDYTATTSGSASTLYMNVAPLADARFWAVVLQSGHQAAPGSFILDESTLGGSDTLG